MRTILTGLKYHRETHSKAASFMRAFWNIQELKRVTRNRNIYIHMCYVEEYERYQVFFMHAL